MSATPFCPRCCDVASMVGSNRGLIVCGQCGARYQGKMHLWAAMKRRADGEMRRARELMRLAYPDKGSNG